jgi:hypothetical protein
MNTTTNLKRVAAATLAIASLSAAALPASSLAAGNTKVFNYPVTVKKGVLASGQKVSTRTVVTDPVSSVSDWWASHTISTVVRTGVNGRYQMPYTSLGYRCTPNVGMMTTSFVCKLQGGDVETNIRLTFTVQFA